MTENNEDAQSKVARYYCKYCKESHSIELERKLIEGRSRFPFPYVVLHNFINGSESKEIMAVLYLDSNLKIRSAELHEFEEGNLFTKEQLVAITNPLLEEIKFLREDLAQKELKLKEFKAEINFVKDNLL